jgi:putative GTP pyrophosphokinase
MPSKAEINRLGDALRDGRVTSEHLVALDDYRRSFQPAIVEVVQRLQWLAGGASEIVQRPSKSTPSIISKLKRQPTLKLTQIQDIAGLRILASERLAQEGLAGAIRIKFPNAKLFDRISQPSFGYRAAHLVVTCQDRPIEIQIRTLLQHAWAHLSERLADVHGHDIKYGGGKKDIQKLLKTLSTDIDILEQEERELYKKNDSLEMADLFAAIDVQRYALFRRIDALNPSKPGKN